MPAFRAEPTYTHGSVQKTTVLLVNLGTPEAPTARALRRYLAEFLSDRRVVEIPAALWKPILHGIILRVRPAKSAAKYQGIWMTEGSPLKVWTQRQAAALAQRLEPVGVEVAWAMRYGQPSVGATLDALKAAGSTRILIVPLYPQYCGATTGSAMDAVATWQRDVRWVPELRYLTRFHDDPRTSMPWRSGCGHIGPPTGVPNV